jgi:2,3-bisphosphoglycerate-independent phosphoglycerate mutase
VPLVVTRQGVTLRENGELSDLIPTALDLLGLTQPLRMSGKTLMASR